MLQDVKAEGPRMLEGYWVSWYINIKIAAQNTKTFTVIDSSSLLFNLFLIS